MSVAPTLIASRYRVLRELGRGGMGVVYLVEHTGTGDHLALKLILSHADASPEVIERFKREARAPAKIKSEHVVRVTDADVAPELGGAPFLVMELLDGQDLEKRLAARGRFSPAEVIGILRQAAIALDKAHAIGITHRDLKPENLFLHKRENGEETLKVVDFGISKLGGESANDISNAGLTKSGAMMGTPLYMSPEQARGRVNEIGPATDVWAIGLIAYRLLTGRIYWTAATLAELMLQILAEPMPPPSTLAALPQRFDAWFARSTDRRPEGRFRSVGEQVTELALALGLGASPSAESEYAETLAMAPAAPPGTYQAPMAGLGIGTTAPTLARSAATPAPTVSASRGKRLGAVVGGALVVGATIGVVAWRSTSESTSQGTPAAAQSPESEPGAKKTRAVASSGESREPSVPSVPGVLSGGAPTASSPSSAAPPAPTRGGAATTRPKPIVAASGAGPSPGAPPSSTVAPPTTATPPATTELKPSPPPSPVDTRPKKYDPSAP